MMKIEVFPDYVIILGTRIDRPKGMSLCRWDEYWKLASQIDVRGRK